MRFILVDQIRQLEPGRSIVAEKTLSPEEELFSDHFPGFPVVPAVLLVEMMAQATGKCLEAERPSRGKPMLAQIRKAHFREWVRPGEVAEITSNIRLSQESVATASCCIQVAGRDMCSSELLFAFMPRDRFAADWRDTVLERFLDQRRTSTGDRPRS